MSITPQGLMRVINGLSGPLKSKAIKLLDKYVPKNIDAKGNVRNPLRKQSDKQAKSQKAVEGQRRYTAGDLINDLLGIKKMGDGTLRAEEKKKVGKSKTETVTPFKKKVVKKTTPKAPPPKPNSIKKNGQQYMKDKSGKDTNVKFNYKGGMLKKGKK